MNKVLLIDDSADDAALITRALHQAGLSSHIFHIGDGAEALLYFQGEGEYADRTRFPTPDIVLLDLHMPGVDGFQLLKWIRQEPTLNRLVVVVLTGEQSPKLISLAYQLGANSFLSKSGTHEEMKNFVQFVRDYAKISHTMPNDASATDEKCA